jgi:hypothetical protein
MALTGPAYTVLFENWPCTILSFSHVAGNAASDHSD